MPRRLTPNAATERRGEQQRFSVTPDIEKPLRCLITGGAGFVGSHLCDRLLEQGHEVIVADSYFTGSKSNLAKHLGNPRFELIRHDVVFPLFVEVDRIYHLACPASPVHYKYNPVKTIKTSVLGTLNMLGLAKRVKARILLASTSEVYGDPLVHPQDEDYWGNVNPIGVRSCYDEGKRVAETLMVSERQREEAPNDADRTASHSSTTTASTRPRSASPGFSTRTGPAWRWTTAASSATSSRR